MNTTTWINYKYREKSHKHKNQCRQQLYNKNDIDNESKNILTTICKKLAENIIPPPSKHREISINPNTFNLDTT